MHFLNRQCVFTSIGLGLVSLGIILAVFWLDIFHCILAKELALGPGTKSYQMWKNPPLSLNFDVYLYNWTNPCNLTASDYEKPILEEIGPYRFRDKATKTKIKWNPQNSTVSYRRKSTYYFVEEESVGRLDDKIVTINAVAVSAAHTARNWNFLLQKQVSMGLSMYSQQTFVIREARELLFDGYEEDLIDMAHEMSKLGAFKLNIPYDRFGWLYGRNESEELAGHFNIMTGKDDISELGKAKRWNYQSATPYYPSPCNEVRGSGGEFYAPGQTKENPLTFFNGELCRYLDLYFTEEQEINGLKVYKYAATERSVDNGTKFDEYSCFSHGESLPSGVMNVSACRYGAPVFVSFPHFHAADPYYLQFVDGLKPDKDKHQFYITMEPDTGIPVEVAARLQVNVMVRQSPNIGLFQETPTIFFPALWFEQKVRIPKEMIEELMIAASMPNIGYICTGVIIGIGFVLLIFVSYQKMTQQTLKKNLNKDEFCRNGIPNEKLNRNIIEAEQSPLMKENKLMGGFDIKHVHELPKAPLAVPDTDFEYNEHSISKKH